MKVKYISYSDKSLTNGKWYEATPIQTDKYEIYDDDDRDIRYLPRYLFMTIEEERNNNLNKILDES